MSFYNLPKNKYFVFNTIHTPQHHVLMMYEAILVDGKERLNRQGKELLRIDNNASLEEAMEKFTSFLAEQNLNAIWLNH